VKIRVCQILTKFSQFLIWLKALKGLKESLSSKLSSSGDLANDSQVPFEMLVAGSGFENSLAKVTTVRPYSPVEPMVGFTFSHNLRK
jgi:hypothetical protein